MLNDHQNNYGALPFSQIPEHRLWHDERWNPLSFGCLDCPERGLCGGMAVAAGLMNCLDLCCGQPGNCDKPCRNNPDYALRVREVDTFCLDNVPRGHILKTPNLPLVVPILFHGKRRQEQLGPEPLALPLYAMFRRRDGRLRFDSHEELCGAFGLVAGTPIVLTGTDKDPPLERWWGFEGKRREIIRGLKNIGISLTTTPNFSLFVDVPRHVDLHAIKRIALVHAEFLNEGLPAALHVNGRSKTDFQRWGEYVRSRPEVKCLSYEFATGTGRAARRELHAEWLTGIAAAAGRPIDLIVRGGIDLLPRLTTVFNHVTVLETWSFMKTMKRQRAVPQTDKSLGWRQAPSAIGAPLDALYSWNRTTVRRWIEDQAIAKPASLWLAAAGE